MGKEYNVLKKFIVDKLLLNERSKLSRDNLGPLLENNELQSGNGITLCPH